MPGCILTPPRLLLNQRRLKILIVLEDKQTQNQAEAAIVYRNIVTRILSYPFCACNMITFHWTYLIRKW